MALNIKNEKVERLAAEVSRMTGETKTEAIRRALEDRKNRLASNASPNRDRGSRIMDYLEREVWPKIPADVLGKKKMTKREREEILGIGPDGYPE
ncbi:MAG TPA: type II toxin-antitoxin system VapB family antitoxin [Terriglobales bacterium]|jgi:antitoxin VapB|nr:type II toxin-antitoxin system VapB family antitoxin [Terriglobales bacterium]